MAVVKRHGVDFTCREGCTALTLSSDNVSKVDLKPGERVSDECLTLTHDSGWTISAILHEDWFIWINEFSAIHPTLGYVHGDFENDVIASSDEAFDHFYANHTPDSWDYGDI